MRWNLPPLSKCVPRKLYMLRVDLELTTSSADKSTMLEKQDFIEQEREGKNSHLLLLSSIF